MGFVDDADLPALYGSADGFAMLCRSRWAGLEQEGFGIVFVEAAAAGCPQIVGNSGGSGEALIDGETGFLIDEPTNVDVVAQAIDRLLSAPDGNQAMRQASREMAVANFSYDLLAERVRGSLESFER